MIMSNTGRYYVKVKGRLFCIEPIDNTLGKGRRKFGDINPSTKKVEGDYGEKYIGSIHEDDSIITKENGCTNIHLCPAGKENAQDYIRKLLESK
jgi:hypothetical protein